MHTAPPNKQAAPARHQDRWPRATPAFAAFERACAAVRAAEARDHADSPAVIAARAALAAADKAYKAAVHADEKEQALPAIPTAEGWGLKQRPRIKCACGSWLDPATDGPRCPDCDRRLPAVVAR